MVCGLGVLVHTQHSKSVCPFAVNEELIIHPPMANTDCEGERRRCFCTQWMAKSLSGVITAKSKSKG